MPKSSLRLGLLLSLIGLAVISRLLPHPHNFTPVGAIALFGAAYFPRKWMALLIPFAAMWLSDLFLNNITYARMFPEYYNGFQWFGSVWVYGAFLLIGLLGMATLHKVNAPRVVGSALGASVLFFAVTNFAVWVGSAMYPKTIAGLMACYAAGIPFFGNTLLGDLVYCGVLFGVFEWVKRRSPAFAEA